jgi:hypothetical protein
MTFGANSDDFQGELRKSSRAGSESLRSRLREYTLNLPKEFVSLPSCPQQSCENNQQAKVLFSKEIRFCASFALDFRIEERRVTPVAHE